MRNSRREALLRQLRRQAQPTWYGPPCESRSGWPSAVKFRGHEIQNGVPFGGC
jgi:hypothetical protein